VDVKNLPPAEGKFAGTVKVGDKGQIVIPKGARDMFGISPGDTLLLLADIEKGIVIVRQGVFDKFVAEALASKAPQPGPVAKDSEEDDGEQ